MRNPGGVEISMDGRTGNTTEVETYTCCHCNCVTKVPVKARPEDIGGYCTMCSKPVCPRCHAIGKCRPFEKWLDKMEARRSYESA